MKISKIVNVIVTFFLFALMFGSSAQAAPFFATISLTPITDGLTAWEVACVGIAAAVILSGVALGGIKFGARWAKGLWKIMTG